MVSCFTNPLFAQIPPCLTVRLCGQNSTYRRIEYANYNSTHVNQNKVFPHPDNMTRAGVFIGVNKPGNLQMLRDAAAGAERMHQWAIAQGMLDKTQAKLITDAGGKNVGPDEIFTAINEIINGAGVDQLIIYFAGHGVNINRGEYWLLSDAPTNANAAVNVSGNVELARYCGIKHVVFVSDACRAAPEGLQAQRVRGSDIFPNDAVGDKSRAVDQFFACVLGRTAAELKDPVAAADNFKALYTETLLKALWGQQPDVLEASSDVNDSYRYVRPRGLQAYLEIAVPQRVRQLNLQLKVNQDPDAIITSDGAWVSRIAPEAGCRLAPPSDSPGSTILPGVPPQNLREAAKELARFTVRGERLDFRRAFGTADLPKVHEQLLESVSLVEAPFGPDHFETGCGIKVRGTRVIRAFASNVTTEILGQELVRVHLQGPPAVSVLVEFEGGLGTVIPVLSGFLAAVTFEDGELVDVAYEPSATSPRGSDYKYNAQRVRRLRAVAAAASQHGRFRLDGENARNLAKDMQRTKGIDPTLSIYAAYAYHDLQDIKRIADMSGYLRQEVGITFFDLALLGRQLIRKQITRNDLIVPFFPLLSQGWALLNANRVKLDPAIDGIEKTMKSSLWSLFDSRGVELLRRAIEKGYVL